MDTLKIARKIVKICDTSSGNIRLLEISKVLDEIKEESEIVGAYECLCNIRKTIDSKISLIDEEKKQNK